MRRFALARLVCWLGVAAPAAALRTGDAAAAAEASRRRRSGKAGQPAAAAQAPEAGRSAAQPVRTDLAAVPDRRALEQRIGDPARYQRYQDLRDGVLFSDVRYEIAKPDGAWQFHARADNVGYRDQRYFADYERIGRFVISGLLGADSAVLQRRYDDAVYGHRRHAGARRRDAARDPERRRRSSTPTSRWRRRSNCASGATSAVSTWSRRRSRTSTSRPASRRRSTAASCPGGPASASATTSRWRSPTIRARTTSPSAPSGRTRATCCVSPTAARGSTTSRRR